MSNLRAPGVAGLLLTMACILKGCAAAGVIAQAIPASDAPAEYKGLAGQSVAVYVWADRGVRIDWPDIQLNITSGLLAKLKEAQKSKVDDLKGTTFPLTAATIARFQDDHPDLESEPITNVAPQLGTTRVIYVEIQSFQTRSETSVELYRGSISALVKVLEIKGGKATSAFDKNDVRAVYPPKSLEEGVANLGDEAVYAGTIKELTTQLAVLFFAHPQEQE